MNIFEFLKTKMNRNRIKRLNPGNSVQRDNGDTKELITISTIESILRDKNTYKEFMDPSKNQRFFEKGCSFEDYQQAVKDYVRFFSRRNVVFDKKELKRASTITGEKYKNSKQKKPSQYSLEEIAARLIYEPNVNTYKSGMQELNSLSNFTAFINDDHINHSSHMLTSVCGMDVVDVDLRQQLLSIPSYFDAQSKALRLDTDMYLQIGSMMEKMQQKNKNGSVITQRMKFYPQSYSVNPDFEKIIMSKIPTNIKDKGRLAYEIYKAVYSTVEYDVGYFIKKNDELSEDYVERLKSKDISELDENNKKVVCTTATELYCYMLSKYGINSCIVTTRNTANVNNTRSHWYAEVFLDDDVISADATNGVLDSNKLHMTDMTRIKLGLNPANFISQKGRDYSVKVSEKSPAYALQGDVDFIKQMIDELDMNTTPQEVTVDEKIDILQAQLKKIKDINIGNLATVQYIRSLFSKLFLTYQNVIGLTGSLYIQDGQDNYNYYPIIYLKQVDGGYRYYSYDKDSGLKQMSGETIEEMIGRGELQVTKGKMGHVPGVNGNWHDKDDVPEI